MDNVVMIKIEGVEYEFKLKSASILYPMPVQAKRVK